MSLFPISEQLDALIAGNSNDMFVMLNLLMFKNYASYANYGKRVETILPNYGGGFV